MQASRDILRERGLSGRSSSDPRALRSASAEPSGSRKRQRDEVIPPLKRTKTELVLPVPEKTDLPILFVPFEARFNNKMIGGYARTGNQTSSVTEARGAAPVVEQRGVQVSGDDMDSTFGSMDFWKVNKTDPTLRKVKLFAKDKGAFQEKIETLNLTAQQFYEAVVEDRLRYLLFSALSGSEHGLPEVVVLSERLLDWPDQLRLLGRLYHKRNQLDLGVPVQEMAAYVLHSKVGSYKFGVQKRADKFKGAFEETWLLVTKGTMTVACVHLSSNYVNAKDDETARIFGSVVAHAQKLDIHAIMGDLNLNTYGLHGGTFPVSSRFEGSGGSTALKTTFASSSGSGDKAYMGGMICDSRVALLPTLNSMGSCAVPPWFTQESSPHLLQAFSDHHSIYSRYAFYEGGSPLIDKPSTGAGGDCFFDALTVRLTERGDPLGQLTTAALRTHVIGLIRLAVEADPQYARGRHVLRQVPTTDFAIPYWCANATAFMDEMSQPGAWVEDTILPFIAQNVGVQFIIQYVDGYAVFATDGSRTDHAGADPGTDDGVHMNCHGNHFWV